MGLLDNFEKGLERVVGGAFARTFKSGLQPIEITAALRRELDTKAAVVSRDRILAPNKFAVNLSPSDFERMAALGVTLIDELTELVQSHATAQRYQFAGGISIDLVEDPALSEGMIQVLSRNVKGEVAWKPVLDVDGKRHPITKSRTIVGRGSEADITINDSGTSRKHIEILWDGTRAEVRDLDSTNGSMLDGRPVKRAPLPPESEILIGRTRIVFRVLAQSASIDRYSDLGIDSSDGGGGGR